jgi:hypothetical protein
MIVEMNGKFQSYKYFSQNSESIYKFLDFEGQFKKLYFTPKRYDVGIWNDDPECTYDTNSTNVLYLKKTNNDVNHLENFSFENQLLIMSHCCDNHLISGSNISFWSAFLNPSPTKQVKYLKSRHADFYPTDWLKI